MGGPLTEYELENSNFWAVFFDFLKEFVSDVQTFIEVKQHPQAGPETPHTMCEKFEGFWKNSIFDYFLNFSHGSPPPMAVNMLDFLGTKIKMNNFENFKAQNQ